MELVHIKVIPYTGFVNQKGTLYSNCMQLLSGKKIRDEKIPTLEEAVRRLGFSPTLVIFQVGKLSDATSYIRAKQLFAVKIGVTIKHIELPDKVTEDMLLNMINLCNESDDVHGIIVQLPLPAHIDSDTVVQSIDPRKDPDGLINSNLDKWVMKGRNEETGKIMLMPATARGVYELLKYYKIDVKGKKVTVIGRSKLVGKPIAQMVRNEGGSVTVCHRETGDISRATLNADIIISAAGHPGLIGSNQVRTGQTIIDIGLSRGADGTLVGDVKYDEVKNIVAAITPVPGGVGPMTVLALFENLLDLCNNRKVRS